MTGDFRKGWTLIELLVVIAIVGMLVAFMAPRLVGRVVSQARVVATRQQMDEIRKALVGDPSLNNEGEMVAPGYVGDVGSWPPPAPGDTTGLSWLWRQPPGVPAYNPYTRHGWNGPYIRSDSQLRYLDDAWENAYRLIKDPTGKPIGLESAGPDGVYGPPVPGAAVDDIRIMF